MQHQTDPCYLDPSRVAGSGWMERKEENSVALAVLRWLPVTSPSICRTFQNTGGKPLTAADQIFTSSNKRRIWRCDSSESLGLVVEEPVLPTHLGSHKSELGFRLRSLLFWAGALHQQPWEDVSICAVLFMSSCSCKTVEENSFFTNLWQVLGRLLGLWLRGNS